MREPRGGKVTFQVVHAVSRNLQVAGKALCKACAHKEGTHKAGARGVGDGVDVLEFDSRFLDGGFRYRGNLLQVRSCCNFGNDASV